MHFSTESSFYPSVFLNAFTEEHNFPLGEQCDVQEAFTRLCSNTKETAIGDAFNIGTQTRKTCMSCGNFEDSMPETQTSLIVSPRNGIDDLENAIRNCLEDTVNACCSPCKSETNHFQHRKFIFLPETLVIFLARFKFGNGRICKNQAIVNLPNQLRIGPESFHYNLRACALHHGSRVQSGHYTALIFNDNKLLHIDDTRCSDVTCEWQLLSQQTVYLTFFTKVGTGLTLFSQISSGCGLDEFEKGDETGNCNETFEEKA